MDKFLNERLFDVILEKAFIEHEKEELKTYPNDVELEKEYPISNREIRRFNKIVKEKEYGKKLIRVYFDRVAVAILCMISLFFALMMTNNEVRAAVENIIIKWYDKYTEFVFTEASTGFDSKKVEDIEIGYIPADFVLDSVDVSSKGKSLYYKSIENSEHYLVVEIFYNDSTSVAIDNERFTYEKFFLNSCEVWFASSDSEDYKNMILVGENVTVFMVGFITKNEIIKIAKNIY